MSGDVLLAIWLGFCLGLVVCVKAVAWLLNAAGRIVLSWLSNAL